MARPHAHDDSLSELISDLEDQTWRAQQKSGRDFLPFLSHDCIMLFPLGMKVSHHTEPSLETVMTSEAFQPWTEYDMDDVAVTPIGLDGAVISYSATAFRPGMREPFKAMISSIWRRDPVSERWQMCLHQQTPFQDIDL